ncbi:hypothetical protein ZIOFF_067979 [Zingiber officinale]|uniref:Uncharacterized protein n=1 Tax=Zingiber officinale TaxID=94328 RepID=A0A8J5C6E7_ZINOF|nr:hypothetical protein ZIOFF_067979 [Zingiber officinale]
MDTNFKPHNSTWLQKADLLFVVSFHVDFIPPSTTCSSSINEMGITQENPVGTGFSFVEEESLLEKSDWEAAANLTALLKKLYHGNATMQRRTKPSSSWQSYCSRFAVTTSLSVLHAIRARQLKLKLEGVALGNNWMSPKDYVVSRILNRSMFFQLSNESNLKSPCISHGGLCSETC